LRISGCIRAPDRPQYFQRNAVLTPLVAKTHAIFPRNRLRDPLRQAAATHLPTHCFSQASNVSVVDRTSLAFCGSDNARGRETCNATGAKIEGKIEGMMTYKGVEFTVSMTAIPDIWKWEFQIGEQTKSGKTEAKLQLLAVRRVQTQIDRELRKRARTAN
jgi:hypothetical protein